MPSRTRRRLLAGLASVPALTGCSTLGSGGTDTPAQSETVTSTRSPTVTDTSSLTAADLTLDAAVVDQPTAEAPGRVQVALHNRSGVACPLSGGDPIPIGANPRSLDRADAAAPLALLPAPADRVNNWAARGSDGDLTADDAVYDGCWHLPGELVLQTELATEANLSPDAAVAATVTPLGHHDAACPEGTYAAHGDLALQDSDQTLRTTLELRVDGDRTLAVDGSTKIE